MTKLVQYVGTSDRRVITAAEFEAAGFTGIGTMIFAADQPTDFYRSVSDAVAIFLLAQGDFVASDGSTVLDIFQNAESPSATPEVNSVQFGENSDPHTGMVVVPVDGDEGVDDDTPALRALGRAAGKALAGDDDLVADALTKTMFGEDTSVILFKKEDGSVGALQVPINTVVGRKASGEIVPWSIADLQAALDAGTGFSLASLSDVVTAGIAPNTVLGTLDGENWQPVVVGDAELSEPPVGSAASIVTADYITLEPTSIADGIFDGIPNNATVIAIEQTDPDEDGIYTSNGTTLTRTEDVPTTSGTVLSAVGRYNENGFFEAGGYIYARHGSPAGWVLIGHGGYQSGGQIITAVDDLADLSDLFRTPDMKAVTVVDGSTGLTEMTMPPPLRPFLCCVRCPTGAWDFPPMSFTDDAVVDWQRERFFVDEDDVEGLESVWFVAAPTNSSLSANRWTFHPILPPFFVNLDLSRWATYGADEPTHWATSPPANVGEALDRIAAQVYSLGTSTPIP